MPRWLRGIHDTRCKERIVYHKAFLACFGLSLFSFALGSRRQLDFDLRDDESDVLPNLNRLAGTQQKTLPVHDTLEHFIGHVGPEAFADGRRDLLWGLIRMKALDDARLCGRLVVAADGTGWLATTQRHCDRCLVQKHAGQTVYLHEALEAKVLTPSGMALSIGTAFIENPPDQPDRKYKNDEERKQACELGNFELLAKTLREDYPQTRFLFTNDSLYGCGPAIQVAKDHRFSYIFTFKEGRTPARWAEFQALLRESPENTLTVRDPDGSRRTYRWVNELPHEDTEGRLHLVNALEYQETRDGVVTAFDAWMTDLPLRRDTVDAIALKGGRIRWTVENQGFNAQKNSELNLEHAYSHSLENAKAYYYLLQIAHLLFQLLVFGSLLRRIAQAYGGQDGVALFGGLKKIFQRLLEAFRRFRLPDEAFAPSHRQRIALQIT
jgi:hypothetical protein